MKKILLYIFTDFAEFEITPAISILRRIVELHTVALKKEPIQSEAGLTLIPDLTIDEISVDEYDGIIIPGGDMKVNARASSLFKLIYQFYDAGRFVASICSGAFVLAKSGILETTPYTVTYTREQRDFLQCFSEANFLYQPVVQSKNIITAQGHAYVDFALILYEMLGGHEVTVKRFYRGLGNTYMEGQKD